jgi:hypothetical protein
MEQTALGGSARPESDSMVRRLYSAPFVFFRPFPWEASGAMALIASLEGVLLGLLLVRHRTSVRGWFRGGSRDPVFLLSLFIVLGFSLALSAISNWGIVGRHRTMALPFLFVLACSVSPTSGTAGRSRVKTVF